MVSIRLTKKNPWCTSRGCRVPAAYLLPTAQLGFHTLPASSEYGYHLHRDEGVWQKSSICTLPVVSWAPRMVNEHSRKLNLLARMCGVEGAGAVLRIVHANCVLSDTPLLNACCHFMGSLAGDAGVAELAQQRSVPFLCSIACQQNGTSVEQAYRALASFTRIPVCLLRFHSKWGSTVRP